MRLIIKKRCAVQTFRKKTNTILISLAILAATILMSFGTARAYAVYEGGDWGGRDFTPSSGDVLSGTFTNIGRFTINPGDSIYAGSGILALFTDEAFINGSIYGNADFSKSFSLTSHSDITISSNGMVDKWESVYLASGGTIKLSGAINSLNSGNIYSPATNGKTNAHGGTLTIGSGIRSIDYPDNDFFLTPGLTITAGSGLYTGRSIYEDYHLVINPGDNLIVQGGTITYNTVVPVPPAVLLFTSGLMAMWFARRRLNV